MQLYFPSCGDKATADALICGGRYAEPLFRLLGAATIDSLDAADYEGCTIVHDLNIELPTALQASHTAVIDVGSLEDVFHFTTGLRSCMELVKPGGHFLSVTPTNGWMGHGFYQFSPEVFFRALDENNGFQLEKILFCEVGNGSRWYESKIRKALGGAAKPGVGCEGIC